VWTESSVTRNSRRKQRSRQIQREQGVPYSVARRRGDSGSSSARDFSRPDFAALYADDEDMPPRIAAALWIAADLLIDEHGLDPDEPVDWLPPVAHREGPALVSRMIEVVDWLSSRLRQGEVVMPRNMAQQVAWAAMIDEAEVPDSVARENPQKFAWYLRLDAGDLQIADMVDVLLPDLDHEFLFEPRWDGIEDDDEFARSFRAPSLHPRRWFEPFYDETGSSAVSS